MRILQKLLLFVVWGLTAIGDGTVFLFFLLLVPFQKAADSMEWALRRLLTVQTKQPSTSKKRKKQKSLTPLHASIWFKIKYFLLGIIFSFCFIFLPLLGYVLYKNLPDPTVLAAQQVPQTTKIYDRNHTLLYQLYANQNRTLVTLGDIPSRLQEATIAIEDKNFYKNPGFDLTAIIRALLADIKGHAFQGGSTITQQLIKSSLLTSEKTLSRKLEEVALAFWAERVYSKKQILEMYFNQVPYGGTAWGIEAASQTYFGKDVKEVDLAESAFLAGMPQAPTSYSPYGTSPNAWKKRQEEVLSRMQDLGYISEQEEKAAQEETLHFISPRTPILAPHFVMYIKDLLIQKYGLPMVEKGGLNVMTSLDLLTQEMAERVVAEEIAKDGYLNLSNGAAVVTNPQNGDLLAMVGSRNYFDPQIDGNVNVTTSLRQPGSSIKIVTYAAALSKGYTPATMLDDTPVTYNSSWGSYSPVNYDGKFHGRVSLRIAFANSFNVPAVKTLDAIGIPTFIALGRQMGISHLLSPDNYGLSLTLGSADVTMLDMATAYGTVANSGRRIDINPILEVTDGKGTTLEKKNHSLATPVISAEVAFLLSDILADNTARSMEFGSNSPLFIPGHTISVKTGTTDDKRDNWTFGYTKDRLVAVWVGNNDNSPMSQNLASGITGAAPIWHAIMSNVLKDKPDAPLIIPPDIVQRPCIGRLEYFVKGTENTLNCSYMTPVPSPTAKP